MIEIKDFQNLYSEYLEAALKAEQNRRITDGMFGFGKKPDDDPCHAAFPDAMKELAAQFQKQNPDSGSVYEVLSYLYMLPREHREPNSAYWMLIAVAGLTKDLIPRLSAQDAFRLYEEYRKLFRRWERLPVQKEIIQLLKAASGS